jgi:mono/diheme cytochrome c family protein
MPSSLRFLAAFLLLVPMARAAESGAALGSQVQAMLDENCVKCHGPLKQKSGLDLDSVEGVLKGSEDGAVVKPGKPQDSPLIAALSADADPHMPPKKQLSPEEIAKFKNWVATMGTPEDHEKESAALRAGAAGLEPAAAIDYFLQAGWKGRGITPAPPCDDATFVRRVYLDLVGRIPKPEEVDAFLADAKPEKRSALVDKLLASDGYARNFREIWDALLMGRGSKGRDQRRKSSGWYDFLETAFRKNRPWNEVVRAIIVARPEKPEDRGALWFLYERKDQHQVIAEALAPIIYGTRVSCAQCHDHPLAREIKQAHYWGLVTAFNRSKNTEKGNPGVSESAVGGFVNFTNLKKESQPAVITMLTGQTIEEHWPAADAKQADPPEGYVDPKAAVKVPKYSRREALADAVTKDNPLLARAFVNYTWAILMGRGIVQPVDEINSKHPASHPELLEWLASDFASHHCDMRRLVRSIVLSRGYALAGAGSRNPPPPEAFAAALEKPLTGETIARSAQIASGRTEQDQTLWRSFIDAFPDVLPRVQRTSIQQAMLLANNDQLAGLFQPDPVDSATRLAALPTPEARVREAFRLALIRPPDTDELKEGVDYLSARTDRPAEAIGQLLWALVAGPEFLTNH